jgi:septum formation protein
VPDLYLASQSSRRCQLLEQLGVSFAVISVDVDETRGTAEPPADYATRIACDKACAGAAACDFSRPVLGADTTVVVDDEVFGKPRDQADALRMLGKLSGRTHRVVTAVALCRGREHVASVCSVSEVSFRRLDSDECLAYWASGEPRDKAGAYAIQGRAGAFVSHINGSYSGVVGLPLFETEQLLRAAGIRCAMNG